MGTWTTLVESIRWQNPATLSEIHQICSKIKLENSQQSGWISLLDYVKRSYTSFNWATWIRSVRWKWRKMDDVTVRQKYQEKNQI